MISEFEKRLRQRMDHATAEIEVPRGLARRAARHRQRRIRFQAGAAVGTVAAVTAAVMISTATGAPSDTGPAATALLAGKVESALTAVAGDIFYMKATDGSYDSWVYRGPRERRIRQRNFSDGRLGIDQGGTTTPTGYASVFVSYPARTWYIRTGTGDSLTPLPAPRTSCGTPLSLVMAQDPATLSANIRAALSCGQFTDEGTEHVDGVNAIRLVSVQHISGTVITTTLWTDPATYLLVQYGSTMSHNGHAYGLILRVAWLPPTRANLAQLNVPIPRGFTQVKPPRP